MQTFHMTRVATLFLALALPVAAGTALAQEQAKQTEEQSVPEGILSLLPGDAVTEHTLRAGTKAIAYTATAGTLDLFGQTGQRSAKIFYTAYIAKDGPADRPLTFVFNGGPGAASAYLHLGLVGPRVLEFGRDENDGTRPSLKDNPDSWLAFTDIVLIDPVGTGWSRGVGDDIAASFYGVRQDAQSIAKAIALYTQKNGRMQSTKYLLGESYGGFRSAKVALSLKDSQSILVSGIVMVSPMIDGRFIWGADDDPLGAALQLPSLAAAKLERDNAFAPDLIRDAERFAMNDYLVALASPPRDAATADAVYDRVSTLTGIPLPAIEKARGFVGNLYTKQSAGQGLVVSPYDAGVTATDAYPETSMARNDDAVLDGYTRAYGGAFAAYARNELGFRTEMTYTLLNEDVNRRWDWDGGRSTANASTDLRDLLSVIPRFRLLVAHGYSDVLTPYGFSKYVIDHLPPALADGRATLSLYRGGHMFYTAPASRRAFAETAARFYTEPQDSQ